MSDLAEQTLTMISESDQDTIRIGKDLGALLSEGDVVGLSGELGSGKTWLAKGIALGLGVDPNTIVTSPSFTLINEYEGRVTLYHIDVYRLGSVEETFSTGIEEAIHGGGVAVLEWAERWPEILPDHTLLVKLFILDDHRRKIVFSGRHAATRDLAARLRGVGLGSRGL